MSDIGSGKAWSATELVSEVQAGKKKFISVFGIMFVDKIIKRSILKAAGMQCSFNPQF